MSYMFNNCKSFNQQLNKWDVSKVNSMNYMFSECYNFNQPLNDWNVYNVNDMSFMFNNCRKFNQPLHMWNVSNVKNMNFMFSWCYNFNQPLDNWDISNVVNMSYVFNNCIIEKEFIPIKSLLYISLLYKDLIPPYKIIHKSCPITMDLFEDNTEIIKTICNHVFSKEAMDLWLNNNNTCPICRTKL
jgi:surface protein